MKRFAVGLVFLALFTSEIWSCPFCNSTGVTLAQEAASASLIVFGSPRNARLDPREFSQGTTEIEIEKVIKSHPILEGKKVISISKFLPVDPKQPMKFLIFGDVYKGELDAYRGTPFKPDSKIATYLQGALALKDKSAGERLRYYFDFLDDSDVEIAQDAYTEFGNVEYKDFRPVAEKFPAEKVVAWLNNSASPVSRLGLYGSILGHCGKPEHAATLRAVLSDPERMFTGGVDGVFAGLTILDPKGGWETLEKALLDKSKEYLYRYAALRACRFIWEFRPDVVPRSTVTATVAKMLDQVDLADIVIEDLRKWGYWEVASQIIELPTKSSHDTVLIRRAVLRYALQCPDNPVVGRYLADQRSKNATWVNEVDSLLKQESIAPSPPTPATKAGK
ncbi:MAG: hypothetical protein K1X57_04935 [Gemmataceae bacterium]|nr:hypothetical protein [Gemmataceae bacterium]